MKTEKSTVSKFVLDNGLTVLVYPLYTVPKVSVQIWYRVGSKHERAGQRGLAHFLEHMLFKGTKKLSESDIPMVAGKLSGDCNAFTSQDYTGYLFDFPSQHWHEALTLFADCMKNCTFKSELLDAELGAVVQELKMYRDDYAESLTEQMISSIFPGHPYHHPVIGYKKDLFGLQRDEVVRFYKEHYVPNNAVLVVVGSVEPRDVFERAKDVFGSISAGRLTEMGSFNLDLDTSSTAVTLFRDVQQPIVQYGFVVPGVNARQGYLVDCLAWILGNGKGSRLYQTLVNEHQVATEVEAFEEDLFDSGLFFIRVRPKDVQDIKKIEELIRHELVSIASEGISQIELQRATRKVEVGHRALFEDYEELTYEIGKYFLATDDEQFVLHYLDSPKKGLAHKLQAFVADWLRPTVMHQGYILPIAENEKARWLTLQEKSDKQDEQALAGRSRTSPVESGKYINSVVVRDPEPFSYPKPSYHILPTGMKLIYHSREGVGMIECALEMKAKYYYDPDSLQGLSLFVARMMLEGTENYTGQELALEIESLGMSITVMPGLISMDMLAQDFVRGLELLEEILCRPTFKQEAVEKVKKQMLSDLREFWDKPSDFILQRAREQVYEGHPFSKNQLGTVESIARIGRDDLIAFHKNYITPQGAALAIVGDLKGFDVPEIVETKLARWKGAAAPEFVFPPIGQTKSKTVDYQINRDQITLCYAGLSLERTHQDYDKLLLFDQFFTGGMSSRLFQLREKTGWFYTIGGSLVMGATKQPGIMVVKTIVSPDKLSQSETLIEDAIKTGVDSFGQQEFVDARNALVNGIKDGFESGEQTARAFLFLERYGFAPDYFDKRAQQLLSISHDDICDVVRRIFQVNSLAKLRAGRLK